MTQSKSKQHNAPKRSTKRKGAARPGRRKTNMRVLASPARTPAFVHKICGNTDPFCPAARGAKQPDSGSIATLAVQSTTLIGPATNANGVAAVVLGPYGYRVATGFTSNTLISTLGTDTLYDGMATFNTISQYRVVSFGVEVFNTASAMTSTGWLGVAVVTADVNTVSLSNRDILSQALATNVIVPCNTQRNLAAVSFQDGKQSKLFNDWVPQGGTDVNSNGNDVLIAYMSGGPASAGVFTVKVTINYELSFNTSSYFNRIATKPSVPDPSVDAGKTFVARTISQVVAGGSGEMQRRVHSAAESFGRMLVRGAGAMIGGYLGGPTGAAMGANMIMDVD